MAHYEFRCLGCRKKFSLARPISSFNPRKVKCPKCGSKKVEQQFSTVYAITSRKS